MRAILKYGALTAGLSEVDRSDNRKSFKVVKIPSKTNWWKVREMSRKQIQGNVFALIGCQAHGCISPRVRAYVSAFRDIPHCTFEDFQGWTWENTLPLIK